MNASRREVFTGIALWAFSAAMITGAAHVLVLSVRRFVFGDFIWIGSHYIWMTPAGYAIVFGVAAALLIVAAAAEPSLVGERLIGFVFGFLGSLAVLLLFPRLHPLAALIAAIGVGVRVGSWAGSANRAGIARLHRSSVILAATLAAAGGALALERRLAERRDIGSLKNVSAQAPNVLLIILDTVRGANMGFLGYHRDNTPALARLGNEGVVFQQAYATAPWTLPSHAGFFTGQRASELGADWLTPLDDRYPTVAEIFRDHGYVTAGFVANYLYTTRESGLDRGFIHYEDNLLTPRQLLLSTTLMQTNMARSIIRDGSPRNILRSLVRLDLRTGVYPHRHRKVAGRVADDFLRWERSRGGRPFFAFVNLFDAHGPHSPPPWPRRFSATPTALDRYDGAIAYMDSVVGALLDSLERRGVLRHSVVVITSDHGESFGEHGLTGHGNSLYRTELHVPLIFRFPPGIAPGVRVDRTVSLRDLPATLIDLAGLPRNRIPGVSLKRMWSVPGSPGSEVIAEVSAGVNTRREAPVSRGPMISLIDDSTHYIRNGDGVEELYAWRTDSAEKSNLAESEGRTRIAGLRARLGK